MSSEPQSKLKNQFVSIASKFGKPISWICALLVLFVAFIQGFFFLFIPRLDNWKDEILASISTRSEISIKLDNISAKVGLSGLLLNGSGVSIKNNKSKLIVENVFLTVDVFRSIAAKEFIFSSIQLSDGTIEISDSVDFSVASVESHKRIGHELQKIMGIVEHLSLTRINVETKRIRLESI